MKILYFILFIFCYLSPIYGADRIHAFYTRLNPKSIKEHLAFYRLYPDTNDGKNALKDAWQLLSNDTLHSTLPPVPANLNAIVDLLHKRPGEKNPTFHPKDLQLIDEIASYLHNRSLKGYEATSEEFVLSLNPSEIDLSRALFLSQLGNTPDVLLEIKSYEALIDLMALQILAYLPKNPSPEDKIAAINHYIFREMGFRFPPHSLFDKNIDLYTFLPSVLDSRKGVCLGVSILYMSLAQRLNLTLEAITPPGHIYVRYNDGKKIINIETTARGIDLASEEYLNFDTKKLQVRSTKEMIGFAHVNQASIYLQSGAYEKSLACYLKALDYMPSDYLLQELMGINYLLLGDEKNGFEKLNAIKDIIPEHTLTKNSLVEDLLNKKAEKEAIKVIFTRYKEDRESALQKKEELLQVIKKFPFFRAAILSLALTYVELHRGLEALKTLEYAYKIDPEDANTNYYLSVLYLERYDYKKAWQHFLKLEDILKKHSHEPKILNDLRLELLKTSP